MKKLPTKELELPPQTLKEWFSSAQRVSCSFYADFLSEEGRTENVSCHLIDDLIKGSSVAGGVYETITFLHGYPSCSYDFLPVIQHLVADRRIKARLLLIDLLGFGDSDKGVGEARFSIQQQASMVERVWERYDIHQSHLVVHDFAVSIAQELLSRQPKGRLSVALHKIFWLNGSVFVDLYRPPVLQRMLMRKGTGWLVSHWLSRAALDETVSHTFSKEHKVKKETLDAVYEAMENRGGLKMNHKLVQFLKDRRRYKHVWQGALELAMRSDPNRMLFFWGTQDPLSGNHVFTELHRRYDKYGARVVENRDLGHWPHVEDPERVSMALQSFLLEPWIPSWVEAARKLPGGGTAFMVGVDGLAGKGGGSKRNSLCSVENGQLTSERSTHGKTGRMSHESGRGGEGVEVEVGGEE